MAAILGPCGSKTSTKSLSVIVLEIFNNYSFCFATIKKVAITYSWSAVKVQITIYLVAVNVQIKIYLVAKDEVHRYLKNIFYNNALNATVFHLLTIAKITVTHWILTVRLPKR